MKELNERNEWRESSCINTILGRKEIHFLIHFLLMSPGATQRDVIVVSPRIYQANYSFVRRTLVSVPSLGTYITGYPYGPSRSDIHRALCSVRTIGDKVPLVPPPHSNPFFPFHCSRTADSLEKFIGNVRTFLHSRVITCSTQNTVDLRCTGC
ncbi:hypothetical protein SODALDRAFT_165347 [Sodiomyces alkalinus F11]|uniref:Uncharacterized protein n=1 Tax=Sodiomyces alkalinus (strain CBS 110278 / VKM F-3762 / F11) TaxID=1314773 RepID=A0A3N2PVQ3_SODAK|nr:hypothetical protein SODALDRAFT_165347 [Sodiomyces alkalinus F11]ROT38569.1 hypothetical protein SODALDRAFT_165347 [Sodiomyces alkalinus F11]